MMMVSRSLLATQRGWGQGAGGGGGGSGGGGVGGVRVAVGAFTA